MKEKQNVAPAFPINAFGLTFLGMTLRDYFAAKAMQGMLSQPYFKDTSNENIASWAYATADAMLDEKATALQDKQNDD
jgi:hypothetical protein